MCLFLRCVGKALVNRAKEFLLEANPLVKIGVGICSDVCRYWKEARSDDAGRRADLEGLAQAPADVVRREAEQIAEAGVPPEARPALAGYLQQIPALIRRTLTRRDDPSGKTVPASLRLDAPEDVEVFLPERPPRFQAGDRPEGVGDWELVELLGGGGFGEVWKARNPYRPKAEPVSLKFCLEPSAQRLLTHEAHIVAQVRDEGKHPGIVALQHTYLRAQTPCLEYEYVDGGDLAAFVLHWHQHNLLFAETVPWAGRIIHTLAETVGFAHRLTPPVIHRDLKPANILLQRRKDGRGFSLRIADFGIGHVAGEQALEKTRRGSTQTVAPPRTILGSYTPLYASPQQINRDKPSPTDDVHALGVIWYQLLTGDLRLGAPTGLWTRTLEKAGMPIEQIELLGECVSAVATARPTDAKVLADRLAPLLPAREKLAEKEQQLEIVQPPRTRNAGDVETLNLGRGVGIDFAWVPPGAFWMGGGGGIPGNQQVKIELPFALGIYAVTQAQWGVVMDNNPSWFSRTGGGSAKVKDISDAHLRQFPVEQVSWKDIEQFLSKLNEREQASGWLYRLPSEAEWEYACRGGADSKEECSYHFYLDNPTNDLSSTQANFDGNHPEGQAAKGSYLERTTQVGSYRPNRLGLYDMHGNVSEWCSDWYEKGSLRVIRGGSWGSHGARCQAALRNRFAPSDRNDFLGFRLARVPRPAQG